MPGQKITYTVHVKQTGPGALTGVTATDDLSKVLDDAASRRAPQCPPAPS